MSAEMPKERRCPVNRCGRPVGIGTHMEVVGVSGITERLSVCEDHWQANRAPGAQLPRKGCVVAETPSIHDIYREACEKFPSGTVEQAEHYRRRARECGYLVQRPNDATPQWLRDVLTQLSAYVYYADITDTAISVEGTKRVLAAVPVEHLNAAGLTGATFDEHAHRQGLFGAMGLDRAAAEEAQRQLDAEMAEIAENERQAAINTKDVRLD